MPVCARFIASTLISSMLRSGLSWAKIKPGTNIAKISRVTETNKRRSFISLFVISLVFAFSMSYVATNHSNKDSPRRAVVFGVLSAEMDCVRHGQGCKRLKNKLQTKLHGAATARADHWVGSRNIGSRTRAPKPASSRDRRIIVSPAILTAEGVGEVRMIEDIEEFGPELHADAFTETEHLHRREVHIPEAEIAKRVASHRAEVTSGRWSHHGF